MKKVPAYFKKIFSNNNPSEKDIQKLEKLGANLIDHEAVVEIFRDERTIETLSQWLKKNFPEMEGSNIEIIYEYLDNYYEYYQKILVLLFDKMYKHKNQIFKIYEKYGTISKPIFLHVFMQYVKDAYDQSGLFNFDVLNLLNFEKFGHLSFNNTHCRESIFSMYENFTKFLIL